MTIGTHTKCRQVSFLAGVAKKDLPKGTKLVVEGHHHSIEGLTPQLLERNLIIRAKQNLSQSIKNCVNF